MEQLSFWIFNGSLRHRRAGRWHNRVVLAQGWIGGVVLMFLFHALGSFSIMGRKTLGMFCIFLLFFFGNLGIV